MLLETLDTPQGDIIIYSQNILNTDENFKIIFKDDQQKRQRRIPYADVCRFVDEYVSKNLIVYRLLTSVTFFRIEKTRYGHILLINGYPELIYFDPIYAIKELEENSEKIDLYDLKFRIQQVGLSTMSRKKDVANYAEIYSIDMQAEEALSQNDKEFVKAIFALSKKVPVRKGESSSSKINKPKSDRSSKSHFERLTKLFPEDTNIDPKAESINNKGAHNTENLIANSPSEKELFKKLTVESYDTRTDVGKKESKPGNQPEVQFKAKSMIEMFKSPASLNKFIKDKEEEHVLQLKQRG